MKLSEKYRVPGNLALLCDFANSIDVRSFEEHGVSHTTTDELGTIGELESWLRVRGLLSRGVRLTAEDHQRTLDLREALRSLIRSQGEDRDLSIGTIKKMDAACSNFPLVLRTNTQGRVEWHPASSSGIAGIGQILAELSHLSETGQSHRLKMCASDECHWVFFDRSKPGNRRWCSSALCGNRQKTRAYRHRQSRAHTGETRA